MSLLISSIICYLGIYCGAVVGKIANEELKEGKRYFVIMENIIIGGIIFLIIAFLSRNLILSALSGAIGAWVVQMMKINAIPKTIIVYTLLAASHIFGYVVNRTHPGLINYPAIASLVFLYGFPAGSIVMQKKSLFKTGLYALPYLAILVIGSVIL